MDDIKLAETLQDHKSQIASLKHRMDDIEKLTESIHQLTVTTSNLATEVRHTNETVAEIKGQVSEFQARPGARMEQIKTAIITAIATAIIAAAIAVLFT